MTSVPEQRPRTESLDHATLVRDLVRLGVPRGGLLMVHSSLRSLGHVTGGAPTVINALLGDAWTSRNPGASRLHLPAFSGP